MSKLLKQKKKIGPFYSFKAKIIYKIDLFKLRVQSHMVQGSKILKADRTRVIQLLCLLKEPIFLHFLIGLSFLCLSHLQQGRLLSCVHYLKFLFPNLVVSLYLVSKRGIYLINMLFIRHISISLSHTHFFLTSYQFCFLS